MSISCESCSVPKSVKIRYFRDENKNLYGTLAMKKFFKDGKWKVVYGTSFSNPLDIFNKNTGNTLATVRMDMFESDPRRWDAFVADVIDIDEGDSCHKVTAKCMSSILELATYHMVEYNKETVPHRVIKNAEAYIEQFKIKSQQ